MEILVFIEAALLAVVQTLLSAVSSFTESYPLLSVAAPVAIALVYYVFYHFVYTKSDIYRIKQRIKALTAEYNRLEAHLLTPYNADQFKNTLARYKAVCSELETLTGKRFGFKEEVDVTSLLARLSSQDALISQLEKEIALMKKKKRNNYRRNNSGNRKNHNATQSAASSTSMDSSTSVNSADSGAKGLAPKNTKSRF